MTVTDKDTGQQGGSFLWTRMLSNSALKGSHVLSRFPQDTEEEGGGRSDGFLLNLMKERKANSAFNNS